MDDYEFSYDAKQLMIYNLEQVIGYAELLKKQLDKPVTNLQARNALNQIGAFLQANHNMLYRSENYERK